MARELAEQVNVDAPSSDYPHGRIRDKIGSTPGTPVSEDLYGDMHQFFAELLNQADITPNGIPDSEYAGYQLVDALQGEDWRVVGAASQPAYISGHGSSTVEFKKDPTGTVTIQGVWVQSSSGQSIFTLPAEYRPSQDLYFAIPYNTPTSVTVGKISASTGLVTSGGSADTYYLNLVFKAVRST